MQQSLFHLICAKDVTRPSDYDERYFSRGFAEAGRFMDRFAGRLDLQGQRILDLGCGHGAMCLYAAMHGARSVVGVDIDRKRIEFAARALERSYPDLAGRVRYVQTRDLEDLAALGTFDIVLSKDTMEHISALEAYLCGLPCCLAPGGILALGFGPLWKSPAGGHISYMTRFPWAHLIFDERIIMQERQRFRPGEGVTSFDQVVNKLTLQRFRAAVQNAGLEYEYFQTNLVRYPVRRVLRCLSAMPLLGEYFTFNVYTILKPASL